MAKNIYQPICELPHGEDRFLSEKTPTLLGILHY